MSHFHTTTYEDDNGAEWDIKISFNVFPGQVQTLEDPGFDAELEIDEIWRHEPTICQDTLAWVPFVSESEEQLDSWSFECWEKLTSDYEDNQDAAADHDYERSREIKYEQ